MSRCEPKPSQAIIKLNQYKYLRRLYWRGRSTLFGIVPVKWLWSSHTVSKSGELKISDGMEPVNILSKIISECNLLKRPISDGIFPSKKLTERSNFLKLESTPISVGIVPVRALSRRTKRLSLFSNCNSGGIVPTNWFSFKFIDSVFKIVILKKQEIRQWINTTCQGKNTWSMTSKNLPNNRRCVISVGIVPDSPLAAIGWKQMDHQFNMKKLQILIYQRKSTNKVICKYLHKSISTI